MRFSVIIPAYNVEKTIENTVKCIQKSGLYDFEIVIVDDGSKDGTPAICDRLASEHENIHCIHQANTGVSAARNRGLAEAKGEYVWFFDADDYVDENSMTDAVRIIVEKAPDMLIFGMSFDFIRNGNMYRRDNLVFGEEDTYTRETIPGVLDELYNRNALTSACNKLIKKSVITKNAIVFNEKMIIMEDFLFVLDAIKASESIYTLPQAIYRYVFQAITSQKEDHANIRLARIPKLSEYLKPFETALKEQPKVLASLYFMLLGQKLRTQKPDEIAITADDFCDGPYSKGELYNLCPSGMKKTAKLLKKKKSFRVYVLYKMNHLRNRIVRKIKKTKLYKTIRGRQI